MNLQKLTKNFKQHQENPKSEQFFLKKTPKLEQQVNEKDTKAIAKSK